MFKGCTSLSEITILATDIEVAHCLEDWLDGTSQYGTFYKNIDAEWEKDDIIPEGWDVELIDSEKKN